MGQHFDGDQQLLIIQMCSGTGTKQSLQLHLPKETVVSREQQVQRQSRDLCLSELIILRPVHKIAAGAKSTSSGLRGCILIE